MIHAALNGSLANAPTRIDPVFGVAVPIACPGVPAEVLDPRATWADGAAYDAQAQKLAVMFNENFKNFEKDVTEEVRHAGPQIAQHA